MFTDHHLTSYGFSYWHLQWVWIKYILRQMAVYLKPSPVLTGLFGVKLAGRSEELCYRVLCSALYVRYLKKNSIAP